MAEDSWLKMVADELMLHETQVDALIEAAFPGQLDVAAADVLAAGAYAREPVLLRRRILAASPEEPPESHGFWFRRTRR